MFVDVWAYTCTCIHVFLSQNVAPLGKIPVARMQRAVPLGERDGFQCFAINMKYETSVVLGCHSKEVSLCTSPYGNLDILKPCVQWNL